MINKCAIAHFDHFIRAGVFDLIEVSTDKFQIRNSALERIDGILTIRLREVVLVGFNLIYNYLVMVSVIAIDGRKSVRFLCCKDVKLIKVVVKDIGIRTIDILGGPDASGCRERLSVLIYSSLVFDGIFLSFVIRLLDKFNFSSRIAFFNMHSADVVVSVSFDHKSIVFMILCISGFGDL